MSRKVKPWTSENGITYYDVLGDDSYEFFEKLIQFVRVELGGRVIRSIAITEEIEELAVGDFTISFVMDTMFGVFFYSRDPSAQPVLDKIIRFVEGDSITEA